MCYFIYMAAIFGHLDENKINTGLLFSNNTGHM